MLPAVFSFYLAQRSRVCSHISLRAVIVLVNWIYILSSFLLLLSLTSWPARVRIRTGSENALSRNLLYVISGRSRKKIPQFLLVSKWNTLQQKHFPKNRKWCHHILIRKAQNHWKQSGWTCSSADTLPRWANPDVSCYSLSCCHKRLFDDESFHNWQIKSDLAKTITLLQLVFHLLLWDPAVLPDKMKF